MRRCSFTRFALPRILACLVVCPTGISPAALRAAEVAEQPEADAPSRNAIDWLREHLRDHGLHGVGAAAFATVPLTRNNAAEAARMLVAEHEREMLERLGGRAGGDGVYQVAPRMADRFAAAAMMAGHPNETRPDGLRNLPFAIWVGANDAAHSRNAAAKKWRVALAALAAGDPGGYRHEVHRVAGKGHWMDSEDAAAVPWLTTHTRDLRPDRVVWLQDDVTHGRLYWLAVSEPRARARLVVTRAGQRITIEEASPQRRLTIRLDDTMLDLDEPVVVVHGDHELFRGTLPRTIRTLAKTLAERGDPRGLFSAEIDLPLPSS
jgi:hypothetical protein